MNLVLLSLAKVFDPQIDIRLKLEEVKTFNLEYGSSSLPFLHFLGHYENPFLRFLSLQLLDAHQDLTDTEIKKFLLDPALLIRDYTISMVSAERLRSLDLSLVIRNEDNYFEGKPLPIIMKTIFLMKGSSQYTDLLEELKHHPAFFDFKDQL